jgi:pilus assembly protein CpaB
VDVIATPEKVSGQPTPSTLLLEKARVLAIGRRMVEASADTPYVEYASVTLEVKPADAVAIVNAQEHGTISLALLPRPVQPTPPAQAGSAPAAASAAPASTAAPAASASQAAAAKEVK